MVVLWIADIYKMIWPATWPTKPLTTWRLSTVISEHGLSIGLITPPSPTAREYWGLVGFEYARGTVGAVSKFGTVEVGTIRQISVPMWFVALVALVMPILFLRSTLKLRSNARRGLCPVCGYDLRATPDRCPECGTPRMDEMKHA